MAPDDPTPWTLRTARHTDAQWLVGLKSRVMFADLDRLGRWDPHRASERMLRDFHPATTRIILVDGRPIGSVAVRPEPGEQWIEKFYIEEEFQGRGIGAGVLQWALAEFADARPFRINVLQGSAARRLYERHGFLFEHEDEIDVFLVRPVTAAAR
jgi:GNAT superfamily N-acetyltransferase